MSIFRNFVCDANHHKSFGSGLTYVNEKHQHIFYITLQYICFLVAMYILYTVFNVEFLVPARFLMKWFSLSLHDAFHAGVM